MKTSLFLALAAALSLTLAVFTPSGMAADAHHPDAAATPKAAPKAMKKTPPAAAPCMAEMEAQMKTMRAMHER